MEIQGNLIKAKEIADIYMPDTGFTREDLYDAAMEMAQWKDEQIKQIQEHEIKACNDYIEKHPDNKLMLKYHLGKVALCDELLGNDSKDKINTAFAKMD